MKVKGNLDKTHIDVEFDMYIPLNIEFGSWDVSLEPTIYWRTGDFKKSLIEIGIGSRKGAIRSVTLTQVNSIYDINEKDNLKEIPITEGIPVVEVGNLSENNFTDELKDFKVCIDDNKINIHLSQSEVVSLIKNDRVSFGLDKNNLICFIKVNKLTAEEKFQIMQFK